MHCEMMYVSGANGLTVRPRLDECQSIFKSVRATIGCLALRCLNGRDFILMLTYKVFRDRPRALAHTGADSPAFGESSLETIMAKGQLRGNREPKKPKQPKKPVVPSTLGLPIKPIKPVTKGGKNR